MERGATGSTLWSKLTSQELHWPHLGQGSGKGQGWGGGTPGKTWGWGLLCTGRQRCSPRPPCLCWPAGPWRSKGCQVFPASSLRAPGGQRTLFFIFMTAQLLEPLTEIINKHRPSEARRESCLERALPISHFTRVCKRNEIISQNVPIHRGDRAKKWKAATFDSYLLNLSL